MENIAKTVPENRSIKQVSLEYSKADGTMEMALDTFRRASKRLLNFSIWKDLCGMASAGFKLMGADGGEVHRLATNGDYIRIDISKPRPSPGKGYGWAKIETLVDGSDPQGATESFGMEVCTCAAPFSNNGNIAHFLSHGSSIFVVERKGKTTTVFYFGKNEDVNAGSDSIVGKVRSTVVALGSFIGIVETRWDAMLKGLLEEEMIAEPAVNVSAVYQ